MYTYAIIEAVKGVTPKKYKGENTMSTVELNSKIEALKEWETVIEEAQAEAEAIKDSRLSPIFLSPQKQEKYTTLLHKRFLKDIKWRNIYKVLEISANKDMVKWYADADVEQLKVKLNRRVCSSVKRAAHTKAETADRKILDRWMECSEEEWKSFCESTFSLPARFTWDVEVFVEYLMLL